MICTVCLNPARDKTVRVHELRAGELNRVTVESVKLGGKAVNVAETIRRLGGEVREVTAPVTRTNLKIIDSLGRLTEINEAGTYSPVEIPEGYGIYALCGSLPPDCGKAMYRDLTRKLRAQGATVLVDADGEALRLALEAPPDIMKPNLRELTELGMTPEQLIGRGVKLVVVSMGADGARFVAKDTDFHVPAEKIAGVFSPVGAGDALVGALCYALDTGLTLEEAAKLAIKAASDKIRRSIVCQP
ncbi:tagatose-6-phosphate kinase [Clostridia bacterium]|nr:tagatose-6-phosphate kinase [Clostridia bacterium]